MLLSGPRYCGIIQPAALGRLVMAAPDRQLLLVTKLGFHYGLRPGEFAGLNATDNLIFENNQLAEIFVGRHVTCGVGQMVRIVKINPVDRQLFHLLLPPSGPLFGVRDPWGRFCRFAEGIGIDICRNCALRSYLVHARVNGMSAVEAATRTGRGHLDYDRHILSPFNSELAGEYFNCDFNLARIATLPWHRRRLAQVTS